MALRFDEREQAFRRDVHAAAKRWGIGYNPRGLATYDHITLRKPGRSLLARVWAWLTRGDGTT